MKKRDLKKLALLGIAGAAMMASQGAVYADNNGMMSGTILAGGCGSHGCNHDQGTSKRSGFIAEADNYSRGTTAAGQLMTEDQLKGQLNEQGKEQFNRLNPEGKSLALKLASQACKGNNECKGLGSCKTAEHSCAGKNSCAGTSACKFSDKNSAVKVAAQKQAERRSQANSGSY